MFNFQVTKYISCRPDPGAFTVNTFDTPWKHFIFYAFPPFLIIPEVLHKKNSEEATGILIVLNWPSQAWWPYLMSMIIDFPLLLPRKAKTMFLSAHPRITHPLRNQLQLLACHLSGKFSLIREFQQKLHPLSSPTHGEIPHRSNTKLTSSGGKRSVIQWKLIPFQQLWHMELVSFVHIMRMDVPIVQLTLQQVPY